MAGNAVGEWAAAFPVPPLTARQVLVDSLAAQALARATGGHAGGAITLT